jgi:hypothetical protein
LQAIFKPSRAARLTQSLSGDSDALNLDEVVAAIITATWRAQAKPGFVGSVQRTIAKTVVRALLSAIADPGSSDAARGAYWAGLDDLREWMKSQTPPVEWKSTYAFVLHLIAEFERDPKGFQTPTSSVPILDPIGGLR